MNIALSAFTILLSAVIVVDQTTAVTRDMITTLQKSSVTTAVFVMQKISISITVFFAVLKRAVL